MEYQTRCLVSVFFLCTVASVVVSARHAHHGPKHEYLNHLRRVEKFHADSSCSVPKVTIVQLSEITFEQPILAHEKVSPSITVLHRCESCSACYMQPGYSCKAKSSEMVELTFYVTTITSSEKNYRTGTAQNHTSCWCQPTSSLPK